MVAGKIEDLLELLLMTPLNNVSLYNYEAAILLLEKTSLDKYQAA